MPELPEVETVVRELGRKLKGRSINDVRVLYPGVIEFPSVKEFVKRLKNKKIKDVARRGKLIIINLHGGDYLLVHLKMTGQLVFNQEPHKHTRVIFKIGKDSLNYNDLRKFGFLLLTDEKGLDEILNQRFRFGPEPLMKEFTFDYLYEKIRGRSTPIKSLLLDQRILAGIGNIYADEALFLAKIRPLRKARSLNRAEVKSLHRAIKKVLALAVKHGGSSSRNYVRTNGAEGTFHKLHNVYQRHGLPCKVCGRPLQRIVLGGRGTHYCLKCQK
ncbi:MAG: DNA-formamidopyrimidine glycosylase [Candidatus Doudnabacteria bacterium RIFCSPHIGHO2_02_FULL_46_11]|uniref:Formamidopyrimidine-DNA glycosylase n=1 Tax=Candidatus Doudnabacteria bacterium RIFCSPHIGHO2_02_FULL_46_11 TaxID=1817832 RepID=A0A1F5P577_9BACT|nr:MAG: DNA-formamidopyrimidine glycosylase [Candidatus Doudnabacteria bacterium RIFCSPHIGHO2_02_FULL_46_11]